MPKVSIITINLNNKDGLVATVKSVSAQTFRDIEFIVVDGGSTDGSVDVIKDNAAVISWWSSEKDSGVYNAMNKGISKATGEYCYFLNSGDYLFTNDVLERVISGSDGEDIVYGNMIHGGINKVEHGLKEIRFSDFFVGSIYHQSAFIKKDLFSNIGLYNESLKIVSDWEFFLKAIFINNCSTKYLDINIALYETGGLSFQSPERNQLERKVVLDNYFGRFQKDYEELSEYKFSDFAGIYKTISTNAIIGFTLKQGLKFSRYFRFKILKRKY